MSIKEAYAIISPGNVCDISMGLLLLLFLTLVLLCLGLEDMVGIYTKCSVIG